MPPFQWTGRNSSGEAISGSLDAPTKEAVVAALRKNGIAVETITEREVGSGGGRRLGRIAVGLVLLAGAALMGMIAKGTRTRCTRTATAYDCTMETNMAGFRPLYAEEIRGVSAAADDGQTHSSYDSRQHRSSSSERHRLVLTGEKSTLASEWMAYPVVRTESARRRSTTTSARGRLRRSRRGKWSSRPSP